MPIEGITACVIAKDEENQIGACLDSLVKLVAEIVVVDTGSADRTCEIAQERGARVIRMDWEGDFSQARNRSLQESHSEWALVLDCDERLEQLPTWYLQWLTQRGRSAYELKIVNLTPSGSIIDWRFSLFKKESALYEGRLHETPARSLIERWGADGLARAPVKIIHLGYNRPDRAKVARNVAILEREPLTAMGKYSLGTELLRLGKWDEAASLFEECVREREPVPHRKDMLLKWVTALISAGKADDARAALEREDTGDDFYLGLMQAFLNPSEETVARLIPLLSFDRDQMMEQHRSAASLLGPQTWYGALLKHGTASQLLSVLGGDASAGNLAIEGLICRLSARALLGSAVNQISSE